MPDTAAVGDVRNDILSMTPEELSDFVVSLGEKKYRSAQLWNRMYRGDEYRQMSNLPAAFLDKLSENAFYFPLKTERKLVSAIDGTVKYLFRLYDGNSVESVVMRYEYGLTICVSSQVGCRMGCKFCASTIGGKIRDLLPSEIIGEIIAARKDMGERISHVVMMGIGEPLDNYDNVMRFLKLVNCEDGLGIGLRNVSLSTCGLVDKIKQLAGEKLPITLSVSLHASDDDERSSVMPVNNKWHIRSLLESCAEYFAKTGRRISFEYTLISGVNDSVSSATRLADTLHRYCGSMPLHVNLIPVNEVDGKEYKRGTEQGIAAFKNTLIDRGVNATVRRRLGSDINASCGQLRRSTIINAD